MHIILMTRILIYETGMSNICYILFHYRITCPSDVAPETKIKLQNGLQLVFRTSCLIASWYYFDQSFPICELQPMLGHLNFVRGRLDS